MRKAKNINVFELKLPVPATSINSFISNPWEPDCRNGRVEESKRIRQKNRIFALCSAHNIFAILKLFMNISLRVRRTPFFSSITNYNFLKPPKTDPIERTTQASITITSSGGIRPSKRKARSPRKVSLYRFSDNSLVYMLLKNDPKIVSEYTPAKAIKHIYTAARNIAKKEPMKERKSRTINTGVRKMKISPYNMFE